MTKLKFSKACTSILKPQFDEIFKNNSKLNHHSILSHFDFAEAKPATGISFPIVTIYSHLINYKIAEIHLHKLTEGRTVHILPVVEHLLRYAEGDQLAEGLRRKLAAPISLPAALPPVFGSGPDMLSNLNPLILPSLSNLCAKGQSRKPHELVPAIFSTQIFKIVGKNFRKHF